MKLSFKSILAGSYIDYRSLKVLEFRERKTMKPFFAIRFYVVVRRNMLKLILNTQDYNSHQLPLEHRKNQGS